MKKNVALLLALALTSACAGAQVRRCTDATGKVTFSDRGCDGAATRSEQVMDSRATARNWEPPGYRLQQQLDSYNRAGAIKRETVNGVLQQSRGSGGAVVMDHDPNERIDKLRAADAERQQRKAQAMLDEEQAAQARRQRAAAAAPPPDMFQDQRSIRWCSGGTCYDDNQNSYTSSGGAVRRSDGATCTPSGQPGVLNCR
jgi:hypothetical protein